MEVNRVKIILLYFLFFVTSLYSAVGFGGMNLPYNFDGIGGKASGMGGAFVSISDDGTALFYNPAGISRVRNKIFTINYQNSFLGNANLLYLSYISKLGDENHGIGVSFLYNGVSDMISYTSEQISAGTYSFSHLQISFGYGINLNRFQIGSSLKFYNFNQPLLLEFYLNSFDILSRNPKGLIMDLRNNPGGYLEIVVDIAGWFLKKGDIILKEDLGDNNIKLYKNERDGDLRTIPTVVLINKGTASASEILAGALRDNRGVKLVGEKSFGKGSVQELVPLSNNNSLKITIAYWLTPKGHLINKNGLEPDLEIKNPEESRGIYNKLDIEKDYQLQKALEILKEEIRKK